jgi:hypothetical protein
MKVKVKYTRGGKEKMLQQHFADVLERIGLVEKVPLVERTYGTAVVPTAPQPPTEPPLLNSDGEEISPRTGKPKRKYRRRDMQAE